MDERREFAGHIAERVRHGAENIRTRTLQVDGWLRQNRDMAVLTAIAGGIMLINENRNLYWLGGVLSIVGIGYAFYAHNRFLQRRVQVVTRPPEDFIEC